MFESESMSEAVVLIRLFIHFFDAALFPSKVKFIYNSPAHLHFTRSVTTSFPWLHQL